MGNGVWNVGRGGQLQRKIVAGLAPWRCLPRDDDWDRGSRGFLIVLGHLGLHSDILEPWKALIGANGLSVRLGCRICWGKSRESQGRETAGLSRETLSGTEDWPYWPIQAGGQVKRSEWKAWACDSML